VINIDVEVIKEGRTAAHEKVETEWSATLRKAGFPANYYALAADVGGLPSRSQLQTGEL
jgi:hypothetical protein